MKIRFGKGKYSGVVRLPASKSISNRLLVLKQLYFPALEYFNLSTAHDTELMQRLVQNMGNSKDINVEDAGTVARFLLAMAALSEQTHHIFGTERMHQRPMTPLISSLREAGAEIVCLEKEGHLPVEIRGGNLQKDVIFIESGESSQFFSAMMMIAPSFKKPLKLIATGEKNSTSYIRMTLRMMQNLGLPVEMHENAFTSPPYSASTLPAPVYIENDWSSAAFFVELLSFLETGTVFQFPDLLPADLSVQGDAILADWAGWFGCDAQRQEDGMRFSKTGNFKELPNEINFADCPDLALPVITSLAAHKKSFFVTGVETLQFKESDRMTSLEAELNKCGVIFTCNESGYFIDGSSFKVYPNTKFSTYKDHRITMSLAMLAFFEPIEVEDPMNVRKSFSHFWDEVKNQGFDLQP